MTKKPLTKAEEKAIKAFKDGATKEDAFMLAYPIAKRWKMATVKAKANRLLSSIKRPKKERKVIEPKEPVTQQEQRPEEKEEDDEDKKGQSTPGDTPNEFKFSDEQKELYNACTALQRKVVLNMVTGKMSQRKAYYEADGTAKTDKAADAVVSKMLSEVKVKALYDSLMEQTIGRAILTRDEARLILSDLARTKITDVANFKKVQVGTNEAGYPVYQTTWELKDSEALSDIAAGSIEEISTSATGFKFKKHSRVQAIKQLADLDGWNSATKHELTGADGKPIETIRLDMSPEEAARLYKESLNKK